MSADITVLPGTSEEFFAVLLAENTATRELWIPGQATPTPQLVTTALTLDLTAWATDLAHLYDGNAELAAEFCAPGKCDAVLEDTERGMKVRYTRGEIKENGQITVTYTVGER